MKNRPTMTGVAIALGVLLAGCTAQAAPAPASAPSTAAEAVEATESPAPSPEPTPNPTPAPGLAFDVTTADGYTANVVVIDPEVSYSSEIANAAPGFTDLVTPYFAEATITNTTAGRTAAVGAEFHLYAAYSADSRVCQTESYEPGQFFIVVGNELHCFAQLGIFMSREDVPLAAGESAGLGATGGMGNLMDIPEADADALVSALNSPLGYAVGSFGEAGVTFNVLCSVEAPMDFGGNVFAIDIAAATSPNVCS